MLRPDFKFQLFSSNGLPESRVADIKTVSCGAPTWYKSGVRAVDRRAAVVPGEYLAKARAMDRELGFESPNQGPVGRRLQEFSPVIPLIFGGFAEVSEGVHNLLDVLSRARLKKESMNAGKERSENRKSEIVGQLRRKISLATWKANTSCLLSRVSMTGDGSTEAGKRRNYQKFQEFKMKEEQEAVFRAMVTGHSIIRNGRFWLD